MAEGAVIGTGEEARSIRQPTTSGFASNHPGTPNRSLNLSFLVVAFIHGTQQIILPSTGVPGIILDDGNTTVNKTLRNPCPCRFHVLVIETETK